MCTVSTVFLLHVPHEDCSLLSALFGLSSVSRSCVLSIVTVSFDNCLQLPSIKPIILSVFKVLVLAAALSGHSVSG